MRSNELKFYQLSYVNAKKRERQRKSHNERESGSERGSSKNYATICYDPTSNSIVVLTISYQYYIYTKPISSVRF